MLNFKHKNNGKRSLPEAFPTRDANATALLQLQAAGYSAPNNTTAVAARDANETALLQAAGYSAPNDTTSSAIHHGAISDLSYLTEPGLEAFDGEG